MHRTRLRTRAGGLGFDPASLFLPSGAKGLWYDQSDISTGFQDSAGTTPQTASGQPTGRRSDKSGKTAAVVQATSAARPTFFIAGGFNYDSLDGVDDSYSTSAFSAGTLTSNMDFFMAVSRNNTQCMLAYNTAGSGTQYIGVCSEAGSSQSSVGAGTTLAYNINGTSAGTNLTEAQFNTALPKSWAVVQITGVDLSDWTAFATGLYSSSYPLEAGVAGIIICPAQTDAKRAQIRRWLGAKVGLSL